LADVLPPLQVSDGGAAPLVLVDGAPVATGASPAALEGIDVASVESIEILRGPFAAERYGPDASGGAILINLKSN
jgi:outer membrane cobalamin receptor